MEREIAIVGAGPVGCVLALTLARRGYDVVLYEGRPDPLVSPPPPGRSINLTLAERSWGALREVGLEGAVRDISIPLTGRMIHGEDGGRRFQPYTLDGDAIWAASRTELTSFLVEAARSYDNITLRFGHRCRDLDLERRVLRFDGPGGQRVEVGAQRVFGADGAFSAVRRSLLRAGASQFLQQLSPVLYKELRVPPAGYGECAFEKNVLHLWPRGECMIAAFPNLDWSLTVSMFMPFSGDVSFQAFSDDSVLEDWMREYCADLLEASPDLLHDFFARPPSPLVAGGCSPWIQGDWLALIGDAAHAIVPFLGQGLNAGLEDCSVLAGCIDAFPGHWTTVLNEYQHARLDNCEALIQLAEQHYDELAKSARDPRFPIRKALEAKAHRMAPDRFVPVYTMVTFQPRPYAEIHRVRARQEEMLDRLMALPDIEARWDGPEVELAIKAELALLKAASAGQAATPVTLPTPVPGVAGAVAPRAA
ncbi:MAG: FAD-dependent oxidoreductase [Solirubrobacteraceae bacterium]